MAKKTAKKKKSKKTIDFIDVQTSAVGGHRDLAEKLSQDYYFYTQKLKWQHMPDLLDMDQLTSMLQQIDPVTLEETMKNLWAQGFLIGMLHQLALVAQIVPDEDEEEV